MTRRLLLFTFALCGFAAAQQPPGLLVDSGGYRLHLYCTGVGNPVVMIIGGFSFDWALVQPGIAKQTRVCTYDASGNAWSDPGPEPTCRNRVHEIHAVLHNGKIEGPYVLVGFSTGALFARMYARDYPDEVGGLILIDHAYIPPARAAAVALTQEGPDSPPAVLYAAPIEIGIEDEPGIDKLPAAARELHRWAMSRDPELPTAELAAQCSAEIGNASLGDVPLVVVSTANDAPGYAELQKSLLALSHRSSQLIAAQSFHSIEISQPEIIIQAIRRVIEATR
ncbi:MAG TPA: alpha/beta hydrolase [Bryobacteraceae bacterium]|jgi:pimeloyl-ACP methyl ester carboxylesterase|nr:alpha/beta hydrolase [Bryobacteraceae bacterium]